MNKLLPKKEEGYFLYKIDYDEGTVRAWYPTQHTIISISSEKQGLFYKDDYIRISPDEEYIKIDESHIDNYPFVLRVIESTLLNELDAYVYIIVKTIDHPIRDKNKENWHINEYFGRKNN